MNKNNKQDLFQVFASSNIYEANLVKTLLEGSEIKCIMLDENTIRMNPLYSEALGGIKIMVSREDIERAKEVILNYIGHL